MPNSTSLFRALCLLIYNLSPFFAFGQTDTVPPQLLCKASITHNIYACWKLEAFADDFLDSYTDNISPANQLEFGIRRTCIGGSGFPEDQKSLLFYSYDLFNSFPVEIWARDQAGNTSACQSHIIVADIDGICDPYSGASVIFAGANRGIPDVQIHITGSSCAMGNLDIIGETFLSPVDSSFAYSSQLGTQIPSGFKASVTATKNINPRNGITIHDLFLINQHILGITPLTNPFQLIAADVDQDGQITQQDRLLLRRLMNGTITELPNGRSWRFVPADFVFDPLQPLVFPETVEITADMPYPVPQFFEFLGVKIGDVDFSADPLQ